MNKPEPTEYADEYYGMYVNVVPEGDIFDTLTRQRDELLALLEGVDDERGTFRYQPGKWSIKEVLGHVIDAERVFASRTLAFARGDETALPGFDQDVYIDRAELDQRPLASFLEEFRLLRDSNVALFRSLDDDAVSQRRGVASECTFTARAKIWIIAGHAQHHLGVLKERYGLGVA